MISEGPSSCGHIAGSNTPQIREESRKQQDVGLFFHVAFSFVFFEQLFT